MVFHKNSFLLELTLLYIINIDQILVFLSFENQLTYCSEREIVW